MPTPLITTFSSTPLSSGASVPPDIKQHKLICMWKVRCNSAKQCLQDCWARFCIACTHVAYCKSCCKSLLLDSPVICPQMPVREDCVASSPCSMFFRAYRVMPRLTTAAAPAPRVRNMRISLNGALASLRSSTSPAFDTAPLMFSVASSHSRRSRNCLRSGSCSTAVCDHTSKYVGDGSVWQAVFTFKATAYLRP